MLNGLFTLRGAWDKVREEPVLKFLVVAISSIFRSDTAGLLRMARYKKSVFYERSEDAQTQIDRFVAMPNALNDYLKNVQTMIIHDGIKSVTNEDLTMLISRSNRFVQKE